MKMPYVCEGTIVRTSGREGKVVSVDRRARIVLVRTGKTYSTDKIENLQVVSYKEV